jgi:hypothetical protein
VKSTLMLSEKKGEDLECELATLKSEYALAKDSLSGMVIYLPLIFDLSTTCPMINRNFNPIKAK